MSDLNLELSPEPFVRAMKPVLDSLAEFKALVISIDNAGTGKVSKDMQQLKTAAVGMADELARAVGGMPKLIEDSVKKSTQTAKAAARAAGKAAGKEFADGMQQAASSATVRVTLPPVKLTGGASVGFSAKGLDSLSGLAGARSALVASASRDSAIDAMRLASPLANLGRNDLLLASDIAAIKQKSQAELAHAQQVLTWGRNLASFRAQEAARSERDIVSQTKAELAHSQQVLNWRRNLSNFQIQEDARRERALAAQTKAEIAHAQQVMSWGKNLASFRQREASEAEAVYNSRIRAQVRQATWSAAGNYSSLSTGKEIEVARSGSLAFRDLGREMNAAHSAARGLASGFNAMWLTWGQLGPLLAGAAISNAFTSAVRSGGEFEQKLAAIAYMGGASAKEVDMLAAEAMSLSRSGIPQGPVEIAEGLKTLALAGLDAREQLAAIKPVLNFSIAGEMELGRAAESLVGIATAYGYAAEGFGTVSDVVAKAAAISMTSVADMTEAFKQASTVAQQFGVSIQDSAAMLTLLGQIGIKGSSAGTAMRNMYNELLGMSKGARNVLQNVLKVEVIDNTTRAMKPLVTIMRDMSAALAGKDFKSQQGILQALGNERGLKALSAGLMAVNQQAKEMGSTLPNRLEEIVQQLKDAPGFAAQAAVGMSLTTQNQIKSVWATLQSSLVESFQSMQPAIQSAAAELRRVFGSAEFRQAITSVISGIATLTNFLVQHAKEVAAVAAGYLLAKGIMFSLFVGSALVRGINLVSYALGYMVGAIRASAAAATLLNISMGPVGWIAAAVTAAGAAWLYFSGRAEEAGAKSAKASEEARKATQTHIAATLEGAKEEIRRLDAEYEAMLRNTDAKKVAVDTEATIAQSRLGMLHQEERAVAALALQHAQLNLERTQGRLRDRSLDGTEYGSTAQGQAELSAAQDSLRRVQEQNFRLINRQDRETDNLSSTFQTLREKAGRNADLASQRAASSRLGGTTGPGTFDPDGLGGAEARARREAEKIYQGAKSGLSADNTDYGIRTAGLDRSAARDQSYNEFIYNLGLKSFEEFETEKDRIAREHAKKRDSELLAQVADNEKAAQELRKAFQQANEKSHGAVAQETLNADLARLTNSTKQAQGAREQLALEQENRDQQATLRRVKGLLDATQSAKELVDSSQVELDNVRAQSEQRAEIAKLMGPVLAAEEARARATAGFRAKELELAREIARLEADKSGDPNIASALGRAREQQGALAQAKRVVGDAAAQIGTKEYFDNFAATSTATLRDGMVSAIVEGGTEGAKKLKDVLRQVLIAKPLTLMLEAAFMPSASAAGSFLSSAVSFLFGGGSSGGASAAAGASSQYSLSSGSSPFGLKTRASGGQVIAGNSYWVGEDGPELATFEKSGYVHSASESSRLVRQQGGGKTVTVSVSPTINIDSRTDQAQVAKMVSMGMQQSEQRMVRELKELGVLA